MTQYFDDSGNPIEAYSQEELDEKLEELVKEVKDEKEDEIKSLQEELEKVSAEKKDIDNEVKGASDKEINFKNLREKSKQKDEVINDLKKKMEEMETGVKEEIGKVTSQFEEQKIHNKVLQLADGDEELAKKIKVAYSRFADKPKDDEELAKYLQDAYILATGGEKKSFLNSNILSSGGGSYQKEQQGKITPEVKDVAGKLEIGDDDLKKYKLI